MMEISEAYAALKIIDDTEASQADVAVAMEVLRRAGEGTISKMLHDAKERVDERANREWDPNGMRWVTRR